jgi:hypothetical protein
MRFIDRFTLDDVSAKVWWPFAMVLLVLFVLTFPAEHRAVAARHRDTAALDAALGQRLIQPNVASAPASLPVVGSQSDLLNEEVHDEILVNDTRIRAVRLWSPQHFLLWSSLREPLDSRFLNDAQIDAAIAAAGGPTWVVTKRTPTNQPGPATFSSYTAIGGQPFVAQFEYRDAALTSDVRGSWLGYQIAIGLGLLLVLTLSLLSMREPAAEIGTGVPFFARSVPEDLALIEVDRAVAIEQAGDRIKERLASLQHKLEVSEAARLRAEGRLQQALAALAQPGRRSVMPVPQPTPVPREVVEVPEFDAIVPPEPEPVVVAQAKPARAPRGRSLVPVKKKERAPRRTSKPRPVAVPGPKPSAPKPVVETPQPEPVVETPQPEPAPIVPPPDPVPAPEPISTPEPLTTPVPEPVPMAKAEPTDAAGRPEVVVVPELQPARTSAGPESASDLLDRLVEPVPDHGPSDAANDLRAKLARTAAIKKPGSKERREADEQHRS